MPTEKSSKRLDPEPFRCPAEGNRSQKARADREKVFQKNSRYLGCCWYSRVQAIAKPCPVPHEDITLLDHFLNSLGKLTIAGLRQFRVAVDQDPGDGSGVDLSFR